MKSYGLPVTGMGGITLFGIYFNQLWLVGLAVGAVAVGALLIRLSWRRRKTIDAR